MTTGSAGTTTTRAIANAEDAAETNSSLLGCLGAWDTCCNALVHARLDPLGGRGEHELHLHNLLARHTRCRQTSLTSHPSCLTHNHDASVRWYHVTYVASARCLPLLCTPTPEFQWFNMLPRIRRVRAGYRTRSHLATFFFSRTCMTCA